MSELAGYSGMGLYVSLGCSRSPSDSRTASISNFILFRLVSSIVLGGPVVKSPSNTPLILWRFYICVYIWRRHTFSSANIRFELCWWRHKTNEEEQIVCVSKAQIDGTDSRVQTFAIRNKILRSVSEWRYVRVDVGWELRKRIMANVTIFTKGSEG